MKKRIALAGTGLALALAWSLWGSAQTPGGQPELKKLDAAAFEQLRSLFNGKTQTTRVVALLSPT